MSATRTRVPEPLRRLAKIARAAGWIITYSSGGGHLHWRSPSGDVVVTASTPGDWRSHRNERARLRKAGLAERRRP